jgi:hypothetical protein
MQRTKPPYRADHVGSLIRPDTLIKAREHAEQKAIPEAELRRIQQAAIRDVVRMQEELGLKLVTDVPPTASGFTARRPCRSPASSRVRTAAEFLSTTSSFWRRLRAALRRSRFHRQP